MVDVHSKFMKQVAQLHNQRGSALLMVLFAVVVIGLALGLAGRTWSSAMQQEREEELLFRGDQYRRAIESYYQGAHGGAQGSYPRALADLLKDPRSLQPRRHIRQLYSDPFTGEEFELIQVGGDVKGTVSAGPSLSGIKGVRSKSQLKPFKQDGFPLEYETFKEKTTYAEWEFIFEPAQAQTPNPSKNPQGENP